MSKKADLDIYSRTDFDPEIAERVCQLYAEGLLGPGGSCVRLDLTQICAEVEITTRTLRLWLARYPSFVANFNAARELYADHLMEEALEIADDKSHDTYVHTTAKGEYVLKQNFDGVHRAKLQVDTRIKIASKLYPEKYGDRLQINSTSTVTHIDETLEGKQLRVRNLLEEAKRQGYDMKEIYKKLGLSEVNVLPEDYSPYTGGISQKMLEEPVSFSIPKGKRSHHKKKQPQEVVVEAV